MSASDARPNALRFKGSASRCCSWISPPMPVPLSFWRSLPNGCTQRAFPRNQLGVSRAYTARCVKRFEFPLDSLLRLKTQRLEMEETLLKRLLRDEQDLLAERRKTINMLDAESAFIAACGRIPGDTLLGYAAYQTKAAQQIDQLTARIGECRRQQEASRLRIRALEAERELLEKLRARRYREWARQCDKEIDALAHEAFLSRLSRHRGTI